MLDYLKDIEPKNYQPLYGHDEININAGRLCQERLQEIKKIYNALSKELKRPLRVLDFGCNLGFFSFHLAKWGVVTGIDIYSPAINVCRMLADEHPSYQVQFFCGRIEDVIRELEEGQFDLVLGLNVFHHLCKKYGWTNVKNLLAFLAEKVNAAIFELALKSEPALQHDLPDNYRDLIAGFDCIKLLSYNKWNSTSQNERPLCYASKKFVYLEKFGLMKIDRVQYNLGVAGWRYFYC